MVGIYVLLTSYLTSRGRIPPAFNVRGSKGGILKCLDNLD